MLTEPVELRCIGGFAVIYSYGVARTTNDFDFISRVPNPLWKTLCDLAGLGSALHQKHKVYLEGVAVATPPVEYETRLRPLFPDAWRFLKLYALEPHDLALTKLQRDYERDRDDVRR